ncbi:MAG TPA: histidine phosphatase family protein [Burkholderiaceae bacterium]|nr:histidine phosphatase family protein [Burkholderiaceae bacterium]HNG79750.1 histidine phosphatase family protein [Burkholderiaceae bacterium]
MTLFLIRHGETDLNVSRVLQPPDTPLSARGRAQAAALAARLANMAEPLRPAGVLSSDQPRALQTAQVLSDACGLTVTPSVLLRERHFGDWRGRPYDELPADALRSEAAPPGGESGPAFRARVDAALAQVLRGHAALAGAGPLLVVSHGLLIWDLLARHLDLGAAAMPAHLGNTSLTVFDAAAPHPVRLLACTRHLDGGASGGRWADDPRALCGG